jgi:hypothetical protein
MHGLRGTLQNRREIPRPDPIGTRAKRSSPLLLGMTR